MAHGQQRRRLGRNPCARLTKLSLRAGFGRLLRPGTLLVARRRSVALCVLPFGLYPFGHCPFGLLASGRQTMPTVVWKDPLPCREGGENDYSRRIVSQSGPRYFRRR
jgi:hypothetical protein